jgi:transposase
MHTDQKTVRRDWRIPDELWACIQPLLPPRKPHPLGCHRPRVDDRQAMDAIFFVLRTGCQWKALNATSICSSRSAHRRFQEWAAAGVFLELWTRGLGAYDVLQGIDWEWWAMDGAMTKAPLGGETGGQASDRPREDWHQTERPHRWRRRPHWPRRRGGQAARLQDGRGDAHEPPHRAPDAHPSAAAGNMPGQR